MNRSWFSEGESPAPIAFELNSLLLQLKTRIFQKSGLLLIHFPASVAVIGFG
jgi:hypothetical protein